jgi:predicted RNA-binding Zn ribbon-like protein
LDLPVTVAWPPKGVNLLFAHDTEMALASAAALVNTSGDGNEELVDMDRLDRFVARWGWTGRRTREPGELEGVRALRPRLRAVWETDEVGAVDIVNDLLREAAALPQLVRHDGWDYHVHATSAEAPLADRIAVDAAMALVDVIRTKQLHRLRICAAEDCADVLVDFSKNHSRRFCDRGCGNRANVAAYRARLRR